MVLVFLCSNAGNTALLPEWPPAESSGPSSTISTLLSSDERIAKATALVGLRQDMRHRASAFALDNGSQSMAPKPAGPASLGAGYKCKLLNPTQKMNKKFWEWGPEM